MLGGCLSHKYWRGILYYILRVFYYAVVGLLHSCFSYSEWLLSPFVVNNICSVLLVHVYCLDLYKCVYSHCIFWWSPYLYSWALVFIVGETSANFWSTHHGGLRCCEWERCYQNRSWCAYKWNSSSRPLSVVLSTIVLVECYSCSSQWRSSWRKRWIEQNCGAIAWPGLSIVLNNNNSND